MPAVVRQYRFRAILAAVAGDAPTIKENSLNKLNFSALDMDKVLRALFLHKFVDCYQKNPIFADD